MADLTLLLQNPTEAQKDTMLSKECMASSWSDVFAERDSLCAKIAELETLVEHWKWQQGEAHDRGDRMCMERDEARAECERLRESLEHWRKLEMESTYESARLREAATEERRNQARQHQEDARLWQIERSHLLTALQEIAKYDQPAEGGVYTKVWMKLGRIAAKALARRNER